MNGHCCFPRKAVHASMISSGQHTGGPARCGSQTEEDWACHLEGDIQFIDSKALVVPMKRLLDLQEADCLPRELSANSSALLRRLCVRRWLGVSPWQSLSLLPGTSLATS